MLLRKFLAIAVVLLSATPAFSQSAQLGAGQVWGNSTAAQKPGSATSLSPLFDQAFGSTSGGLLQRSGSAWGLITVLPLANGGTGASSAPTARTSLGLGTMATQNANSVAIIGGTATGFPTPTNANDVAIKSYVDSLATGLAVLASSALATAAVLPNTPTYSNGASGVGATLTAGSNTTLTVDGTAAPISTVVLVKDQASAFQNGIYTVTQAGSGSVPWILTRATYFDQSAEMLQGSFTVITSGATNINKAYVLQRSITTVGTDALTFNLFNNSTGVISLGGMVGAITCGTNITCAGGSISNPGSATLAGNNTYIGDNLFGDGRPWCDVRAQGALGTGSSITADLAAATACVSLLIANYGVTGGIVYFPPSANPYCVPGLTDGSGTTPITFMGTGSQVLSVCGQDASVLRIAHPSSIVRDLHLQCYGFGSDTFGAGTHPCLDAASTASYARFDNLYVIGGTIPVNALCASCTFTNVYAKYGYGNGTINANAYIANTGNNWYDGSLDNVLPFTPVPVYPTTIAAYALGHVYTKGTMVTVTCVGRSWFWQAGANGTSNNVVQPNCLNYGTNIPDGAGALVWQLVAPNPFHLMQVDSKAGEVFVVRTDMTGFATSCFTQTDTLSTGTPSNVTLIGVTPGGCYLEGFEILAGSLTITGGDFEGCYLPGCAGAFFGPSAGSRSRVNGVNWGNGATFGISVNTGITDLTITNNFFVVDNAVALAGSNNRIYGAGNNCVGSGSGLTGLPGAGGYFPTGAGGNPGC